MKNEVDIPGSADALVRPEFDTTKIFAICNVRHR